MSIRALAKEFGCSQATVSQIIKELATQGYVDRQARKGIYVAPSDVWGTSKRRDTQIVGVMMSPVHPMLPAIGSELQKYGYNMLLSQIYDDLPQVLKTLEMWQELGVAGLLWSPMSTINHIEDNAALVDTIISTGLPAIAVDRYPKDIEVSCVLSDNAHASTLLTDYLIELGHRRIGLLRHRYGSTADDRYEGYMRSLSSAGIEYEPDLVLTVEHHETLQDLVTKTKEWLMRVRPTAAWSIAGQPLGLALIAGAQACGMTIPDDLSIATFDEIVAPWSLTSVIQPIDAIARRAVNMLLDQVKEPTEEIHRVILRCRLEKGYSARML